MAVLRPRHGRHRGRPRPERPAAGADLVLKFLEHFAAITRGHGQPRGCGTRQDGLFYDRLVTPGRHRGPGQGPVDGRHHPAAGGRRRRRADARPRADARQAVRRAASSGRACTTRDKLAGDRPAARGAGQPAAAARAWSASTAWSGCSPSSSTRASSCRRTGCAPSPPTTATTRTSWTSRASRATIDYEPAESTTAMFGGNSNWRGPLWFPLNYLVCDALERYHRFFGDDFTVEYPTGSGQQLTLDEIAAGPAAPADLDLPGRRGRPAALLRLGRPAAARPGLEGQPGVQRVLPRRQRGRARRVAPDRLDRGGRRPDPAPPRGGPRRSATWSATLRRQAPAMTAVAEPGRRATRCRAAEFPLGATPVGRRHQLRRRLRRRRRGDAVPVRRRGPGDPGPAARLRRRRLARLRPRRRARAGLRLPGRRPVRPGPGPALQPGQAAARPVRPGHQRRGARSGRRCSVTRRRPGRAERARLGRPRAAQPGRRPGVRLDATPRPVRRRYADTVIYEVHVKGFTMRHPGVPAELRGTYAGPGARGGRRPPGRPRRDRGRAAAGAPERARVASCRSAA